MVSGPRVRNAGQVPEAASGQNQGGEGGRRRLPLRWSPPTEGQPGLSAGLASTGRGRFQTQVAVLINLRDGTSPRETIVYPDLRLGTLSAPAPTPPRVPTPPFPPALLLSFPPKTRWPMALSVTGPFPSCFPRAAHEPGTWQTAASLQRRVRLSRLIISL